MNKHKYIALGFFTASFIPIILLTGISLIKDNNEDAVIYFGFIFVFYFFSVLATLLLGLPFYILFDRFKLSTWWSTIGAGFLIGGIVALTLREPYFSTYLLNDILIFGPIGAVSAFTFWLFWKKGEKCNSEIKSD